MRRPFKMFFGIAIGIMVLLFVARIALVAFAFAAIATVIYAAIRGLKRLAFEDRYAGGHGPWQQHARDVQFYGATPVEPLFHDDRQRYDSGADTRYVSL